MKKFIQLAIVLYLLFANIGCVPSPSSTEDDEIVEKNLKDFEIETTSHDEVNKSEYSNDEVNKSENSNFVSKNIKTLEKHIDSNKKKAFVY